MLKGLQEPLVSYEVGFQEMTASDFDKAAVGKRLRKVDKLKEKGGEEMATIKVKCPYCGSEEVVKYRRNTKTGRESSVQ